jgi:hypothetical protein
MHLLSRGAAGAGALLAFLLVRSPEAQAFAIVRSFDQAEQRDASGKVTDEASTIHEVACSSPGENGGKYYIYQYKDRPGFRAILPPNWGSPIGGRDFDTQDQAIAAACGTATPQTPAGCGIGKQWDVVDRGERVAGYWDRRGDSTKFDGFWQDAKAGKDIRAELDIQLSGDKVTITRTDAPDDYPITSCVYQGTVSADGKTVRGDMTCNTDSGVLPPEAWSAVIHCEPTGLQSPKPEGELDEED